MRKVLIRLGKSLIVAGCLLPRPASSSESRTIAAGSGFFITAEEPLKKIITQIGNFYKINIAYSDELIRNKTTNFHFDSSRNVSAEKVLDELLTPIGLKYIKINAGNYSIAENNSKNRKQSASSAAGEKETIDYNSSSGNSEAVVTFNNPQGVPPAQVVPQSVNGSSAASIVIKGRVVSEKNEDPIAGASVMVRNTRIGTNTDAEGYFSLRLNTPASSFVISSLGYIATTVRLDNSNNIIRLKESDATLKEVVLTTGIYKRPKENFTGAFTTVSGDQLRQINMVNVLDAVKIFDPAIRIPDNMQFGSDPNKLPNITIRGTNNFPQQVSGSGSASGADFMANYMNNPNQPLFIMDGFEVSLQKIYDLDVNRIASFTILKDAAATAIYGSRSANGVIVVETKQPAPGKLRLSYSGMQQLTAPDLTVYDLTNATEKLEVEKRAGLYSQYATGIRPDADAFYKMLYSNRLARIQSGVNTYWLSQPVTTGYGRRHSLYLDGGDSYVRYGIDFSYSDLAGVMKGSDRKTYSTGMNLSYRNKGLLVKNVLSVSYNKGTNSNYGSFTEYAKLNPYWSPYDSTGHITKIMEQYTDPITGATSIALNPLYNASLNTINTTEYTNLMNQTNLEWNIGNGFRLTGKIALTRQLDESDVFLPAQHTSFETQTDFTKKGSYTKGAGEFFSYDASAQLDYSKKIGKHQIYSTAAFNIAQTTSDFTTVYVEGFPNDRLDQLSFGNGYPANTKPTVNASTTRRVSALGNFSYSYNSRYQADLNISADGSSQFGSEKRIAPFWSTGVSWNMHKESWMSQNKFINEFRLRATVGTTGDNRFPPYQAITTYNYYTDQNYRGQVGAVLQGYGNPNLQWQQTLKQNIGADLVLFKGRINLRFDIYKENTSSLILDITTPPSFGFSSYKDNVGELENRGYEFNANFFPIKDDKKHMYWNVFVNGTHNQNSIKSISNSLKKLNETNNSNDQSRPQYRFQEGQSVNAIWAVPSLGIDPSTGREVFRKLDGTITYDWSAADKVIVGDAIADLTGNMGTSFSWKGITMGIYFSYQYGGKYYNQTLADKVENADIKAQVDRRLLLGRWSVPGDVTYFKGLKDENGRTVTSATNATSRFVQTNNYLNAESISVSYVFSDKLNKAIHLNNTRVTFLANDIFRMSSIQVERGLSYPFARNFTLNISTSF